MAVTHPYFVSSLSVPFCSPPPRRSSLSLKTLISATPFSSSSSSVPSPMDAAQSEGVPPRFMDFPYLSPAHRDLMVNLVSRLESRLDSVLLPCTLPPDVQYFRNQSGSSHAALSIRSGRKSSPVDFILGSWIHAELPSGAALDITTLSAYLNSSTDAPHFLIELIRSNPTSLILILDLPPRKDLVLHPRYLETFYELTELDKKRQLLENVPEALPYMSPSLFVRCAVSPAAVIVRIDPKGDGERSEEILRHNVGPVAMEVLDLWLDQCVRAGREVEEEDRVLLVKRDRMFKEKAIETDLGSNFPRLFGPEVARRVIEAIRDVF